MKIVIAEDDSMQRNVLKILLIRAGHEVIDTVNGQDAWDALQRQQARVLITDWMMPVMNGLQLIQKIRSSNLSYYTYILLLTSNDTKENIVEGVSAGADDYLVKPFDKNELVARLGIGERILNLESRLAYMAEHDILTGLYNRRALYDYAWAALKEKSGVSFIMLDADHFKQVNDLHGHLVGDQTLCLLANTISEAVGAQGKIGRWGGEEFLIILAGCDQKAALKIAEKVRSKIENARLPLSGGAFLQITASLGVSSFSGAAARREPCERDNLDLVIDQADRALYQSKTQGRNCVSGYA